MCLVSLSHGYVCLCVKHVRAHVCACACVQRAQSASSQMSSPGLPQTWSWPGAFRASLKQQTFHLHTICRHVQRESHLKTGEVRKYVDFFTFLRIFLFPIQAPSPGSILVFRFLFLLEGQTLRGLPTSLSGPVGLQLCLLAWCTTRCRAEAQNTVKGTMSPTLPLPSALPAPP